MTWAAVAVLGLAATALLAAHPRLALAVVTALGVYRLPEPSLAVGPLVLRAEEVAILLLAAVWIANWRRYLRAPVVIWLLALGMNQVPADVVSLAATVDASRTLADTAARLAATIATVGLSQWARGGSFKNGRYLANCLIVGGIVAAAIALIDPLGSGDGQVATATGTATRISGVSGNFLASLLLVSAAVLYGKLLSTRWTLRGAVATVLLLATIGMTYVRGSYFDALVVLSLVTFLSAGGHALVGRGLFWLIGLSGLSLVVLSTNNPVKDRLNQLLTDREASTLGTREALWSSAVRVWEQNPLAGVGAKNFNIGLRQYDPASLPPIFYEVFQYPEHQILGLLTETGVVGVLSYEVAAVALLVLLWRCRGLPQVPKDLWVAVFSLMAARFISEHIGTWLSGGLFLTLILSIAVGLVHERDDVLGVNRRLPKQRVNPAARLGPSWAGISPRSSVSNSRSHK